jgi:hypothetical protein
MRVGLFLMTGITSSLYDSDGMNEKKCTSQVEEKQDIERMHLE